MKTKRLYDIISTILGLSKRKKKEFYDVLETIDEEGKTQANYGENDINSPSYIKNREFFAEHIDKLSYGLNTFEFLSPYKFSQNAYELVFAFDFEKRLLRFYSVLTNVIYKKSENKLFKGYFLNAEFEFVLSDSIKFTYDGKTFAKITLKGLYSGGDGDNIIKCGTGYVNSSSYWIAINENADFNNIQLEDVIAVKFNGSDNSSFKTYLTTLYDKISGGQPQGGAKEYNLNIDNSKTTNTCLAFRYYGQYEDFLLRCMVDYYEIHQLPEEYMYDLIQRVKALEERIQ